ncbi:MAG: hypothetical protein J5981_03650, partial [Lachnospira sp.]|nr:hypothetical protein [Lachnospira sp.]
MWGANYDGTVGNGNIENQLTPVKVLDKVKSPVDLGVSTYNVSITNVDKSYPMQGMSTVGDLKISEDGIGTVEFDYLVPNETYNFYIMKSREAEEVFGTSNLLYLIQAVADYSGHLSISYIFTEENQDGSEIVNDLFVVQMTQTDLSSAQVQIDNLQYTGDTQYVNPIVTLDNIVLTQGEDYELSSNYSAVDVGTYNVTISGIGLYTGIINVQYRVIGEGIVFGDANNDGTVDSKDAVLLKKYLAGFTDLEIDLLLCDVNADGAVDSRDAV